MEELSPVTLGFLGSLIAGLMTAVGAMPVLFGKTPSRAMRDMSLGLAHPNYRHGLRTQEMLNIRALTRMLS